MYWGSSFDTSLATFSLVFLFLIKAILVDVTWYLIVVSYFLRDQWYWTSFHCMSFFEQCPFKSFTLVLIGLFVSLLSCMCSLYTLDIKPSVDIWLTIFFSLFCRLFFRIPFFPSFFGSPVAYGVPEPGMTFELQLQTEPQLWQSWIFNPLCQAGDRTCVSVLPRRWQSHCTSRNSVFSHSWY